MTETRTATRMHVRALLALLAERKADHPDVTAAPWTPGADCVSPPRIREALAAGRFARAESAHISGCLWCRGMRDKLAALKRAAEPPTVAVPLEREALVKWLTGAERLVRAVALRDGDALGLARDADRDQAAYHHVFMKALDAYDADPGAFASELHLKRWVLTAARWYVRDQARRQRVRRRKEVAYRRPAPVADHSALWAEIREALARLPAAARELLEPYLAGETVTAMATRLGVDRARLYPLVEKAKADLRKVLDRRGVTAADIARTDDAFEEIDEDQGEE